jgi:hypothetical protein
LIVIPYLPHSAASARVKFVSARRDANRHVRPGSTEFDGLQNQTIGVGAIDYDRLHPIGHYFFRLIRCLGRGRPECRIASMLAACQQQPRAYSKSAGATTNITPIFRSPRRSWKLLFETLPIDLDPSSEGTESFRLRPPGARHLRPW